jgi:pimeloyl-ACP methyl ester carboxylesterase
MSSPSEPSGVPLVLLPGLLCDRALWEDQILHLGRLGPVIVPDLTGQDSVAGLAASVLAMAPPRFALAGLSMGGYVSFEILRQAPERVARLALVDTFARPDSPEQHERRLALMELAKKGKFKGVTPRLLPLLVHPDHLNDPKISATIQEMAERVGREAFLRQQRAILDRPDSRPDLARIAVPTIIIIGREDALAPLDRSEEMAALIPDAKLAIIEHCGHLATLEQPAATTALMRLWLTQF